MQFNNELLNILFDSIMDIILFILHFLFSIDLWYTVFSKEDNSMIKFEITLCSICIVVFSAFYWGTIDTHPQLTIFALVFVYANFCIFFKRKCSHLQYIILFNFITILFALWITVLFGKYYYTNNLIDTSLYKDEIRAIINKYPDFLFPITNFHASIILFTIGLNEYFTPAKPIIYDPHFIQTIIRWLIPGLFGLNFTIFTPNFKNNQNNNTENAPKSQENSTIFSLSRYNVYCTSINNKVYVHTIYKELVKNFGFEFSIKNESIQIQQLNISVMIINSKDITVFDWCEQNKMEANTTILYNIPINAETLDNMQIDTYKVIIKVNGIKYYADLPIISVYHKNSQSN